MMLPADLRHAYEIEMSRIDQQPPDARDLAYQVLLWVTLAKRPLRTLELQHALAVEADLSALDEDNLPDIENMLSVCGGLVTAVGDTIQLAHYTIQEYFESTWKSWSPDAQDHITTICVTYLSFDYFRGGHCPTKEDFDSRLRLHPLYDYAARNWGHHARLASDGVGQLVLRFLGNKELVSAAGQVMETRSDTSDSFSIPGRLMMGEHIAAYFGLSKAIAALIDAGANFESKDEDGRTPLWWAAANGHEAVVQLLLDRGAGVESKDKDGQTPLQCATQNGHEDVVKLLLEKGTDVESKDDCGRTPL